MLVDTFGNKEFSDEVISRWGNFSGDLEEDKGLLHVQMAHLGRLCIAHPELAQEVLEFLDKTVARPDAISEIENAVAISFLDWPELQRLEISGAIPARVGTIIRDQWERGGNF